LVEHNLLLVGDFHWFLNIGFLNIGFLSNGFLSNGF